VRAEESAGRVDWQSRIRAFGEQVRRVRKLAGLSQEELARAARVSQAAVSRLERGTGTSPPLVLVLKIVHVLSAALGAGAHGPGETLEDALSGGRWFAVLLEDREPGTAPAPDHALDGLMRLYRDLPEDQREIVVRLAQAIASILRDEPVDEGGR